jgi:hypothetical protein
VPVLLLPKTPLPLEEFVPASTEFPLGDWPITPETPVICAALKFPEASRLTMALAVFAFVGAVLHFRFSVPLFVTGEPLTVKSEDGALSPTLVTVPVPGNVCPEMKVTFPVWSTLKLVPLTASVESVPLGNRVSVSRTSLLPLTSSVAAGLVVLIPICEN